MKGGVYADDECWDNQITDNTINYYHEEAVRAEGPNTVSAYNLALREPYEAPNLRKREGRAPDRFAERVIPANVELRWEIDDSRSIAVDALRRIRERGR